jgi:hypothetical protein
MGGVNEKWESLGNGGEVLYSASFKSVKSSNFSAETYGSAGIVTIPATCLWDENAGIDFNPSVQSIEPGVSLETISEGITSKQKPFEVHEKYAGTNFSTTHCKVEARLPPELSEVSVKYDLNIIHKAEAEREKMTRETSGYQEVPIETSKEEQVLLFKITGDQGTAPEPPPGRSEDDRDIVDQGVRGDDEVPQIRQQEAEFKVKQHFNSVRIFYNFWNS